MELDGLKVICDLDVCSVKSKLANNAFVVSLIIVFWTVLNDFVNIYFQTT